MDAKTERDPRWEPRPGDELQGRGPFGARVIVAQVEDGLVCFGIQGRGSDYRPIKSWRAWAKYATVIKKGDQ